MRGIPQSASREAEGENHLLQKLNPIHVCEWANNVQDLSYERPTGASGRQLLYTTAARVSERGARQACWLLYAFSETHTYDWCPARRCRLNVS